MIRSEKREFIAIAAIVVLVLLAALPAGVAAATTIFEDDFETGTIDGAKWTYIDSPTPVNGLGSGGTWGILFDGGDDPDDQLTSINISTTCMKNITVSYYAQTVSLEPDNWFVSEYSTNGGGTWTELDNLTDDLSYAMYQHLLLSSADDIQNLRIRFRITAGTQNSTPPGNVPTDEARLDLVTVTGEPMEPALEVNKTVYDPKNETWVKELTAKMDDTLLFKITITNTGNVNLSCIRFWDILDCSLKYQSNSLKINGTDLPPICDPPWFRFKPHVLHPDDCAWSPIGEPCIEDTFTELCPPWDKCRYIIDWVDHDDDNNVSVCDQVYLGICDQVDFTENTEGPLQSAAGGDWYHVDRVPYTLILYDDSCGEYWSFDSVLNWDDPGMNLSNPNGTEWIELCYCKDRYTLLSWTDQSCPGFGDGDLVTMRNERTGEAVQYTVDEEVAIDLVVSREYELDYILQGYYEPFTLEQGQTITIEYNATVERCGVDNNTFHAKGMGCGDNWTYSEPAVVTITVPCPSGEATDPTGQSKEVYTAGEPVYAVGSGFLPNKDVNISIVPFQPLNDGVLINTLGILAGPVPVKTDPNGNITPVEVWSNPVPGHYLMIFDDPDGNYNQDRDPLDDFTVTGAAPLITPPGLVALIGLLSIVAIGTIARKNKKR